MIDPVWATVIIIAFIIIFGVGIPVLNIKASKFVSYRWCVVVVVLALLVGATIDFEVLSDESRKIILLGGIIIAGLYVVLRTIEKVLSKGWLKGASIEAKKGDIEVKLSSQKEDEK
jgi:hypothetical protein